MATIKTEGLDEYIKALNDISAKTEEFCGKAIYHGADVLADSVKSAITSLPTDNRPYVKDGRKRGPSDRQKAGLIDGFGIAKMQTDGESYNVKLGFDGYNDVVTKRWPKGQPNVIVARAVESGNSFMQPLKFMARAVNGSKSAAIEEMRKQVEQYLNDHMPQ